MRNSVFGLGLLLCLVCASAMAATTTFKSVSNVATGVLDTEINGTDTSIVLDTGEGASFPASGEFYVILFQNIDTAYEIVLCDSVSGDTITVDPAGRGAQSTSAATWPVGTFVQGTWTKAQIDDIHTAINAIEAGTNELAQVDLPTNGKLRFGGSDQYDIAFDGTYLEVTDPSSNIFLEVYDNGSSAFWRFVNSVRTGQSDTIAGNYQAFGGTTSTGGKITLYNAADSDTTSEYWAWFASGGDLLLQNNGTTALSFDDATGDVTFVNDLVQASTSRNKMRSLWVGPYQFGLMTGTPAQSTGIVGDCTVPVWLFDAASDEVVSALIALPDYDGSDLEVTVVWSSGTTTSGNVEWNVHMGSVTDDEAPASTTAHQIIDAASTGSQRVLTPSVTVTPDGAGDLNEVLVLRVHRDGDDATNDTMTGDANLLGVMIHY